jgi:hypothetical protein
LGLVASTETPGSGAPVESTTFPSILEVGTSWAKATPAMNKVRIAIISLLLMKKIPPETSIT